MSSLVNTTKCWLLLILLFTLTMGSYWFLWTEVRSPLSNLGKHRLEHAFLFNAIKVDEEQQPSSVKAWTLETQSNAISTSAIGSALSPLTETAGSFFPTFNRQNQQDFDQQLIILYNRVPKTGSTTFVNIAYDLCKKNRFHVLHINVTANMHVLSLPNQVN